MITTDIIIVSYDDKEDLDKCIASISKNCSNYNLTIEDNNFNNRGFTKAVNDGIRKGTAPWIWLLNSDAIVLEGAQQALIDQFSHSDKIGLVGSMQLDPENPDIIKHGGTQVCFPAGRHLGGLISMGHCRFPSKQKWTNFASVMIKRSMVNDIGLLDEAMFLIYSDSDYCYFVRSKGYEVWYCPFSKVLHKLKASKTVSEWHRKDMEAFMRKWGITFNPETKQFIYSDRFRNLDMFP